jgi:hypothetical protein
MMSSVSFAHIIIDVEARIGLKHRLDLIWFHIVVCSLPGYPAPAATQALPLASGSYKHLVAMQTWPERMVYAENMTWAT